jgi:phytoene synthase
MQPRSPDLCAAQPLLASLAAADITTQSRSNFFLAFRVMPKARRDAIYAVYAYCRLIDDIVDSDAPVESKEAALAAWEKELLTAFSNDRPRHPIAQALQDAHRRFGIRYEHALLVLKGCQMDLHKRRYATWAELSDYCFHVASAVGLLCIALFGCRHPEASTYAVHLGQALQLTNILRDVAEDAARDRIYVPKEALAEFGVSEQDVLEGKRGPHMLWLLRHLAGRARQEYALARTSLPPGDRRVLLPAEIMGSIYFAVLQEAERQGDAVLLSEVSCKLPKHRKLNRVMVAAAHTLLPSLAQAPY